MHTPANTFPYDTAGLEWIPHIRLGNFDFVGYDFLYKFKTDHKAVISNLEYSPVQIYLVSFWVEMIKNKLIDPVKFNY